MCIPSTSYIVCLNFTVILNKKIKIRQFPANVSEMHVSLGSASHLFLSNSFLLLFYLVEDAGVGRKPEYTDNYRYWITKTETANHADEKPKDQ